MKSGSSFLLFVAIVSQGFGEHIAQSLGRRDLVLLAGCIKIWVVISPTVVLFPADLACGMLGRLFLPGFEHLTQLFGITALTEVDSEMCFPIAFANLQTVSVCGWCDQEVCDADR